MYNGRHHQLLWGVWKGLQTVPYPHISKRPFPKPNSRQPSKHIIYKCCICPEWSHYITIIMTNCIKQQPRHMHYHRSLCEWCKAQLPNDLSTAALYYAYLQVLDKRQFETENDLLFYYYIGKSFWVHCLCTCVLCPVLSLAGHFPHNLVCWSPLLLWWLRTHWRTIKVMKPSQMKRVCVIKTKKRYYPNHEGE